MNKQEILQKFTEFYLLCHRSETGIHELLGQGAVNDAKLGGIRICIENFADFLYDAADNGEDISEIRTYIELFTGWRVWDRGYPSTTYDGSIYEYSKILVDPDGIEYNLDVEYNTMWGMPTFKRIDKSEVMSSYVVYCNLKFLIKVRIERLIKGVRSVVETTKPVVPSELVSYYEWQAMSFVEKYNLISNQINYNEVEERLMINLEELPTDI